MYETIIWATDGSDGADLALEEALRLAELSGGRIVAVHCDQRLNGRAGGWPALADEDDLRLTIRHQVDELRRHGVDVDVVIRRSHQDAADTVAALAAELDGDVIVCGTRGRGPLGCLPRQLHPAGAPPCALPRAGGGTSERTERGTRAARDRSWRVRLVVALGGNALLRRGEPAEAATQRAHVCEAASALAALAAEHELVITHGNGPQVGLLALEADAYRAVAPYPLDILGAESQGMIGYLLIQALAGELAGREVVALLTQVVVDGNDPAFAQPTKPIGPVYDEAEARRLAATHGWSVARDGDHFRRVVPSPDPCEIAELKSVARLLDAGAVVICAGGGGVPVVRAGSRLEGVEAVIDKDLTAALLAEGVGADRLVMLTDVPSVVRDWGSPGAEPIAFATPAELRRLSFAAGSMGPKVEAACRFVERSGGQAAIGALSELAQVTTGAAGTQVAPALAAAFEPARLADAHP